MSTFKIKYRNLFKIIRAKCLGREEDSNFINKLCFLKWRNEVPGSEKENFIQRFQFLLNMANGQIPDVNKEKICCWKLFI